MNTCTITPAVPSDAPAIAQVHVATWQAAYRGQLPDAFLDALDVHQRETMWRRLLADPSRTTLVMRSDAGVTGFCDVGPSRDADSLVHTAELYSIYLLPSWWGGGHGTRLLQAALACLQEQGHADVICWVLHTNQRALDFYAHHQFQSDGAEKTDMAGGLSFRELRLRRSLSSKNE